MAKRCWSYAPEKIAVPAGQGRAMIEGLQQGLKEDGFTVSISKLASGLLCRFGQFITDLTRLRPA